MESLIIDFDYVDLYPNIMKSFNIYPDNPVAILRKNKIKKIFNL